MSTYTTGSKESINRLALARGSMSQRTSTQLTLGQETVASDLLSSTTWLKGPAFLHDVSLHSPELQEAYDLIDPDADSEVRPQVVASFHSCYQRCDTSTTLRNASPSSALSLQP